MLAAIVKVSKIMTDDELLEDMKGSFKHKFANTHLTAHQTFKTEYEIDVF